MRRAARLAALLAVAWAPVVHGQAPHSPPPAITDPRTAQLLAGAVFDQLGYYIAGAALDTSLHAWKIALPDSTSPAWIAIRTQLIRALRARPVEPRDSSYLHLSVGAPHIAMLARPTGTAGDTLHLSFVIGGTYQCKGSTKWAGSSSAFEVVMVWHPNWEMPRTTRSIESDGFCTQ